MIRNRHADRLRSRRALHHGEVMDIANRVEAQFTSLLQAIIPKIA